MFKLRFSSNNELPNPYKNPEIFRLVDFDRRILKNKLNTLHFDGAKVLYVDEKGFVHTVSFDSPREDVITLDDEVVTDDGIKRLTPFWIKMADAFNDKFPRRNEVDIFIKEVYRTLEGKNIKDDIYEIVEGVFNGN